MLKQIKKGIVFSLSSLMLISSFSIVGRAEEVGAPPVAKEDVIELQISLKDLPMKSVREQQKVQTIQRVHPLESSSW